MAQGSSPLGSLAGSVVATLFLLAIGCGGSNAPASPSSIEPSDSGAEPDASPGPGALAESDAGTKAALTPDSPASSAPPPEPPDECTPVGVDFEKRARPKLKDCYAAGKKKNPDLQGTVKIAVNINTLGKIKGIKIVEKTLPEPVAQCMLKVVKATPLPEASKCYGRTLTIPVTFPTPP